MESFPTKSKKIFAFLMYLWYNSHIEKKLEERGIKWKLQETSY